MKVTQLTKEGLEKLQNELLQLKGTKRPETVERLRTARGMGDLSENSEYSAAKEELAFVEGRIREVEEILKHAEVVETHTNGVEITLGSEVVLQHNGSTDQFAIVGEFEADPMHKKLSNTSPTGRALLGKKQGDIIDVQTPSGTTTYKILKVK